MNLLNSLFATDIAIDLGTAFTRIFIPGKGLVFNEPSAIAIDKYTGQIVDVGAGAFKLFGREPNDVNVYRPIYHGIIEHIEISGRMLENFIDRACGNGNQRKNLVIGVPGSSTLLEQNAIRHVVYEAKSNVDLVDEGLAALLGSGVDLTDERARLVVDVGCGTTNIATISSSVVVSSLSIPVAGNSIDEAIRDYMRNKYELQVGERAAEEIKFQLNRVEDNELKSIGVVGKNIVDRLAHSIKVSREELCEAIDPMIGEIVTHTRTIIEESQPEVTSDIYHTGITLTGGGALLKPLANRLHKELGLNITIADNSSLAVAMGLGRIMMDKSLLRRVMIKEDAPVWQTSEELVVQ
jgi:rod shape-determining protein MreB and related proteins